MYTVELSFPHYDMMVVVKTYSKEDYSPENAATDGPATVKEAFFAQRDHPRETGTLPSGYKVSFAIHLNSPLRILQEGRPVLYHFLPTHCYYLPPVILAVQGGTKSGPVNKKLLFPPASHP